MVLVNWLTSGWQGLAPSPEVAKNHRCSRELRRPKVGREKSLGAENRANSTPPKARVYMHVAVQVATALGFIAAKTGCPAISLWSDGRFGLGDHASRRPFIRAKRTFQYPRLARKGWSWFSAELPATLHKPNSSSGPSWLKCRSNV
jgi:hypothetical protein